MAGVWWWKHIMQFSMKGDWKSLSIRNDHEIVNNRAKMWISQAEVIKQANAWRRLNKKQHTQATVSCHCLAQ